MGVRLDASLPLPLVRRGKVREIYAVDHETVLLVASDRVSAFDVVLREPIPGKGIVLTQLSAFWFDRLRDVTPHHCLTARTEEIIERVPVLRDHAESLRGRAMLCRRCQPVPFECVVRGYLAGSGWSEYRRTGAIAGEHVPPDLVEAAQLPEPIFTPATKATDGHDENVPYARLVTDLGADLAATVRSRSLALYERGQRLAASRGILIADTKFEYGMAPDGSVLLIDELLTPDSSRLWPADRYRPGGRQLSFDKQPLRDYLTDLEADGHWDGEAPPPPLPDTVIQAMSMRYLEAYRLLVGQPLREVG